MAAAQQLVAEGRMAWARLFTCYFLWLSVLTQSFKVGLASREDESAGAGPGRPNILVMLADDVGHAQVGFMGSPRIRTPNFDALAARGAVLERMHAASPVCSPSRSALLTGRAAMRGGIPEAGVKYGEHPTFGVLRRQETTVAEVLRDRYGYATLHVGKWHLGTADPETNDMINSTTNELFSPPWQRGFSACLSRNGGGSDYRRVQWLYRCDGTGGATLERHNHEEPPEARRGSSAVVADAALEFMEAATDRGQPFLAHVWFKAAHAPWHARPEQLAAYGQFDDDEDNNAGGGGGVSEATFAAVVSDMDTQAGRLIDWVEAQPRSVRDNTIVVFLSDNGPALAQRFGESSLEGFRGWKQADDLRENALLVPFAMAWPSRIPTPFRTRYLGVATDLVATVYDVLGHVPDLPLDGESLLPLLRDPEGAQRETPVRFVTPNAVAAIGPDGNTKVVYHTRANDALARRDGRWYSPCLFHLFDLSTDPAEEMGVPSSREARSAIRSMSRDLDAWHQSVVRSYFGEDYLDPSFAPLDPRYPGPSSLDARICKAQVNPPEVPSCSPRRGACARDRDCCSRRCNPSGTCGRAKPGSGNADGWHACTTDSDCLGGEKARCTPYGVCTIA